MSRVNTTFQITRGREITRVWVFYYYFLISYPISQKRLYKLEKKENTYSELGLAIFAAMKRFERLNNSEGRKFRKEVTLLLYFSLTWKLNNLVTCPYPWWSPCPVSTEGGRAVALPASPPATWPAKSRIHPWVSALLARHAVRRPPMQELPKRWGEIKSRSLLCFLHARQWKQSLMFISLKKATCVGLHTAQPGELGRHWHIPAH